MKGVMRQWLCAGLGLALLCGGHGCEQADTDTWPEDWALVELEMLDEVNLRREAGAMCGDVWHPPVQVLEMNAVIRGVARRHSLDMAEQNFFEHESPDGRDPFDRMSEAGYDGPAPWGENIQAGAYGAADAVASLLSSVTHCQNIMDPDYRVIGVGFASDVTSSYGAYWTQTFGGGH